MRERGKAATDGCLYVSMSFFILKKGNCNDKKESIE